MAKLVSMELPKNEPDEDGDAAGYAADAPEKPRYSYGARIRIDEPDLLDRLGYGEDDDLPRVGAKLMIGDGVQVEVCAVEQRDSQGADSPYRCVSFQIVKMAKPTPDADETKARKERERVGKLSTPTR